MNTEFKKSRQTEEIVNSATHGIAFIVAIVFTSVLVVKAALYGNAWHIVTFSIFGAGMILLYMASTLYHSAKNLRLKSRLNILDHSSIYVMIAATYTPITLIGMQNLFGWILFGIIWVIAIAGVIYKVRFYTKRFRLLSTWIYVVMGLIIIIAIVPLVKKLPSISLWFLLIGGISFSVGAIFYQKERVPYSHGYFHLLTLCGSISHFIAIYYLL